MTDDAQGPNGRSVQANATDQAFMAVPIHEDWGCVNPELPNAGVSLPDLFGDNASRARYWLPGPPDSAATPNLERFWNQLRSDSTPGSTVFVQVSIDPTGPLTLAIPPGTESVPTGWARDNFVSRQSNSPNWSGAFVAAVGGVVVTQVVGSWTIPVVSRPASSVDEFRSSQWVGLDGQSSFDGAALPQIGTTQQIAPGANTAPPVNQFVWFEWWANAKSNEQDHVMPKYIELTNDPAIPKFMAGPGDEILCCLEIIQATPETLPVPLSGQSQEQFPLLARMCIKNQTRKRFVMPFLVYPPVVYGRRAQVRGAAADWIVEVPHQMGAGDQFKLPAFRDPFIFGDCVAAVATDHAAPTQGERTLVVSKRINMIGLRRNVGRVDVIAKAVNPRINDVSFKVQVDGN